MVARIVAAGAESDVLVEPGSAEGSDAGKEVISIDGGATYEIRKKGTKSA